MGLLLIDPEKVHSYQTSKIVLVSDTERNEYQIDGEASLFYKWLSIEDIFIKKLKLSDTISDWKGIIDPKTNKLISFDKALIKQLPNAVMNKVSEMILINNPNNFDNEIESRILYKDIPQVRMKVITQKNIIRGKLDTDRLTMDLIANSICGWENVFDTDRNQVEFNSKNMARLPLKATEELTEKLLSIENALGVAEKN